MIVWLSRPYFHFSQIDISKNAPQNFAFPLQARANAVIKPPAFLGRNWNVSFLISGFTFVTVLVLGVGFGGYASIHTLIQQIDTFGVFESCYQCPAKPKPKFF